VPALPQFVGDAELAEGWLLEGEYGVLDLLWHAILNFGFLPDRICQSQEPLRQLTSLVASAGSRKLNLLNQVVLDIGNRPTHYTERFRFAKGALSRL
jgi:hypothetical protein